MNDWYNDPPETPEVPECCDLEMEVDEDGDCECSVCGKLIIAEKDPADNLALLHGDYLYDEMKDREMERKWEERDR